MQTIDEEYLTVSEAAALLLVAPSTIRRWIREGDLPAFRLGRRRVALKRDDLATLISPVQHGTQMSHKTAGDEHMQIRQLTPEEKLLALEAMEQATALRKRTLADRGGKLFPPPGKLLPSCAMSARGTFHDLFRCVSDYQVAPGGGAK